MEIQQNEPNFFSADLDSLDREMNFKILHAYARRSAAKVTARLLHRMTYDAFVCQGRDQTIGNSAKWADFFFPVDLSSSDREMNFKILYAYARRPTDKVMAVLHPELTESPQGPKNSKGSSRPRPFFGWVGGGGGGEANFWSFNLRENLRTKAEFYVDHESGL